MDYVWWNRHGSIVFLSSRGLLANSRASFFPEAAVASHGSPLTALWRCWGRNAARAGGVWWERHVRSRVLMDWNEVALKTFDPSPPKSLLPPLSHETVRSHCLSVPCLHCVPHARWCKSEPTASAAQCCDAIESLFAICCHTYCSFVLTCINIQPSKSHDQDCHTCGIYFYCQKQDTSWEKWSLFQKYNKLRSKERAPR